MLKDFGAHPADGVPKAELHAHLEGTIHAPVLRTLAALDTAGRPQEILRAARALKSLERKLVR